MLPLAPLVGGSSLGIRHDMMAIPKLDCRLMSTRSQDLQKDNLHEQRTVDRIVIKIVSRQISRQVVY